MRIYTVIANRWGDDHNHSYLVGNYSTKEQAKVAALAEEHWRAGKYNCEIAKFTLDEVDSDVIATYLRDTGEEG
jgi:hypothetical protein